MVFEPGQSGCPEKRFKPGVSGNPKGRPKGRSVTALVREIVDADDGELAEQLARKAIDMALAGDFRFFREILNRVDGKVADQVQDEGGIQIIIQRKSDDEDDE